MPDVGRDIEDWAADSSLFHRLRDSVIELARGAKAFQDRANYAVERLRPIRTADFPAELQERFKQVQALDRESVFRFSEDMTLLRTSRLSPAKRRLLVDCILNLYEEMLKARVRLGID